MAATGTVSISTTISGMPSGTKTYGPANISLAAANSNITTINSAGTALLQNGDNTITVPAGTTMALIVFPVTANTIKLRAGGTTGAQDLTVVSNSSVVLWCAFTVATMTSFILNASALTTGVEISFV